MKSIRSHAEFRNEQYLTDYDPRVRVLATSLFRGRAWPVAWIKPWGRGKVFYLALGHDADSTRNPFFRHLFTNGCCWAGDGSPYEDVRVILGGGTRRRRGLSPFRRAPPFSLPACLSCHAGRRRPRSRRH